MVRPDWTHHTNGDTTMKKTLVLLAATTALSAAIAAPTWSAVRTSDSPVQPFAAFLEFGQDAMPLILASGDDDDEREYRNGSRSEDDDDDHERKYRSGSRHDDDDDECDGDDQDDDDCGGSARNAAPAGTTPPPQNGLFGNGTPPVVQMN